ncbi:MAG: DNA methyltransferase [Paludibacteraceae bacterium]|nr:DNA methyltransferase [Paludibacteraceae bacterium]MBQ6764517.1 DNA methyltransferase [Paludibacteraceae bacterium]
MAKNANLGAAKNAKNDEFYTQYADIQKEVNAYIEYNPDVFRGKTILLPCDDPEWSNFTKFFAQNFEFFGLKKLISTSYAIESKKFKEGYMPSLFETESPHYDIDKTRTHGKIFVLDHDTNASGRIDIDDLEWKYLEGDGDFRSKEVTALRDEADIIITNPPFSLFREFVVWIMEANKQFLIIGNSNSITYKEIFPFIKNNNIWVGVSGGSKTYIKLNGEKQTMGNTCWFTNLDHGRRHEPLKLMSMADNLRFNKKLKGQQEYMRYANYDAIDVPTLDLIPSDYDGVIGVPLSFLGKYCPDQFEIIWRSHDIEWAENHCQFYKKTDKTIAAKIRAIDKTWRAQIPYFLDENGNHQNVFQRLFIRKKQ